MLTATKPAGKTKGVVPTKATRILFDAGRKTRVDSFGEGILPPTRWTGDHRYAPFTVEEAEWAASISIADRAAEIDAEEDAYNAFLEQQAFEDAAVGRLSRGHCL